MDRVPIETVKRALRDRLDSFVPRCFPAARQVGPYWKLGDLTGAPGGSLVIWRSGPKRGEFWDFSDGAGGSALDLYAAGRRCATIGDAISDAIAWCGLAGLSPREIEQASQAATEDRNRRDRDAERNLVKLRRSAKGHYLSAQPIAGTASARYLLQRGVDVARFSRPLNALRHKPMRCPEYSRDGAIFERPCLIAPVIDAANGATLSLWRTYLHCFPDGRVRKATADPERPMEDAKRAYCAYRGGLIPLWKGAATGAISDATDDDHLTISEGIEDGLSVALILPERRVCAACSLDNIGFLKLPARITRIAIAAQNDVNPKTLAAFERAANRLTGRGIDVTIARPPAGVKDWNDWLIAIESGDAASPNERAA